MGEARCTVMASAAKSSSPCARRGLDCFAPLAMTGWSTVVFAAMKTLFNLSTGVLAGLPQAIVFAVAVVAALSALLTGHFTALLIATLIAVVADIFEWMLINSRFHSSVRLMEFLERLFPRAFGYLVRRGNTDFIDRSVRSEHKPSDNWDK
jgi:hypothetical protein